MQSWRSSLSPGEGDGALHSVLVVTRNVAGELEIGSTGESPDEGRGLARFDPDAARMIHGGHRVMLTLLLALHHVAHHLSMLGVFSDRPDDELVRVEALVAHDKAN